jgi:hypothetical protein
MVTNYLNLSQKHFPVREVQIIRNHPSPMACGLVAKVLHMEDLRHDAGMFDYGRQM